MTLDRAFWALYLSAFLTGWASYRVGGMSIFLNDVILAVFIPLAVLRFAMRRSIRLPTWIWLAMLAFLFVLCVALITDVQPMAIAQTAQIVIFLAAVLSTAFAVADPRDLRSWFVMTCVGCGLNALVGLYQSVRWISTYGLVFIADGKWFRISGLFVSPIDYVSVLMIGLALAGAVERRWLRVALCMLYGGLLILSMSRSGIIILAIAVTVWLVQLWRSRAGIVAKFATVAALVIAAIGLASVDLIASRVADIGNAGFNTSRLLTYQDAIRQSTEHAFTFFFGHGLGTYAFYNPSAQEVFTNTHNVYLFFLYSTGVVGLGVFVWLIAGLLRTGIRELRPAVPGMLARRLPQSVLLTHAFVWVVGLVETIILGVGSGWLIGAVMGLPLAMQRLAEAD